MDSQSIYATPYQPGTLVGLTLEPVAVTTWVGFVFAQLGARRGDRRPLADQLNGTDGWLAAYPLAELRCARRLGAWQGRRRPTGPCQPQEGRP